MPMNFSGSFSLPFRKGTGVLYSRSGLSDRGITHIWFNEEYHETKFKSMEEKRSDALEMAAKENEEREAQTTEEINSSFS